jgi:3-oxoacyl-[acyl-carrier protein] reductase
VVCIHYASKRDFAEALVSEIAAQGGEAFACGADLRDDTQTRALFTRVDESDLPLEALINSAGILRIRPIRFLSDTDVAEMFDVNALAALRCLRLASKGMARRRAGAIVNIGSLSRNRPLHGQAGYAMSKAALLGLTQAAAMELAAYGITVNAIEPGPLGKRGIADGIFDPHSSSTPLGRLPTAEDVADCTAFLCSHGARCITGLAIRLDAGLALTTWASRKDRLSRTIPMSERTRDNRS